MEAAVSILESFLITIAFLLSMANLQEHSWSLSVCQIPVCVCMCVCVLDFSLAIIRSYNNIGDINLDIPTDTCSTVTDWAELVLTLQHVSSSVRCCVGHILLQGISSCSVVCEHWCLSYCQGTALLGCSKILWTSGFVSFNYLVKLQNYKNKKLIFYVFNNTSTKLV